MSESNNLENGCTNYLNQLLDDNNQLNDNVFTYDSNSLNDQIASKSTKNETIKSKPKIIIMGLRKSGKSSIQKVVFHKMSPNETFFLESSNKIIKDDIQTNSFLFHFSLYTLPGEIEVLSSPEVNELLIQLNSCDALIFVLDAQDDYSDALTMLNLAVIKAFKLNPNIKFEVFIHKVDCLSDDNKIEVQRDVRQRVADDLSETGSILLSFHLTSIYDHSIFEAFSKVVQKLIPQLPVLESLLNLFISSCQIEKAFLFDVVSKIYLATDSSAVDMQSYELLCDMIDVVIDISGIYGVKDENEVATNFDGGSSSTIKLNNQTVLYLREVNNFLALVCILREENFDKQGLIDYNFQCFKDAIQEIFNTRNDEIIVQQNGNLEAEQYSIDNSSKFNNSSNSIKDDDKFFNDNSMTNN